MGKLDFNFKRFYDESKVTILLPKKYFLSIIAKDGGFVEPVIKVGIYGLIGAVINFVWVKVGLSMHGASLGIASIFITTVFAIIALFIGGALLLLLSVICRGDTNFETNVRVAAALSVMIPINAIFNFSYGVSLYLGFIFSIAIGLYSIWMLYNALIHTLDAKELTARIISIVLAVLLVVSLNNSLGRYKPANTISESIKNEMSPKDIESIKKLQKTIEEMSKDSGKSLKQLRESWDKIQKEFKEKK